MNAAPENLQSVFDNAFSNVGQARKDYTPSLTPREVGTITTVSTGIVSVSGLPGVGFEELLAFPDGVFGIAFNVDEDEIGVVLLGDYAQLYGFHNRPKSGALYEPVSQRLLPLDAQWQQGLAKVPWPTKTLPEVMGAGTTALRALMREYLFISLFRACAESLTSENASRLAAMQRADKNIDDLLEDLNRTFHRLRQSGIEYGLMAAYAEGLSVLRDANIGKQSQDPDAETTPLRDPEHYQFDLNLADITEVWRRGSVIASWLLDLTADALAKDVKLSNFEGRVSDSGEGRWTIKAAIDEGVPVPVLTTALYARFASRGEADFQGKVLSAMRYGFGGHLEKSAK